MGITIHYTMIADDVKAVIAALKVVKEEARRAGYRYSFCETVSDDAILIRDYVERGEAVRVAGITVYATTRKIFPLYFWRVGGRYICEGWSKTQPSLFTLETELSVAFHKWVCSVLRRLEKLPWQRFQVHDEGGYYETLDEERLRENFRECEEMLWQFLRGGEKR